MSEWVNEVCVMDCSEGSRVYLQWKGMEGNEMTLKRGSISQERILLRENEEGTGKINNGNKFGKGESHDQRPRETSFSARVKESSLTLAVFLS